MVSKRWPHPARDSFRTIAVGPLKCEQWHAQRQQVAGPVAVSLRPSGLRERHTIALGKGVEQNPHGHKDYGEGGPLEQRQALIVARQIARAPEDSRAGERHPDRPQRFPSVRRGEATRYDTEKQERTEKQVRPIDSDPASSGEAKTRGSQSKELESQL